VKGLFLDDIRDPSTPNRGICYPKGVGWEVVRTSYEFVQKIKSEEYDIISFDHYLSDDDPSNGEECFKHFIFECFFSGKTTLPQIVFHTADRSKREELKELLVDYSTEHGLKLHD
jgi:hypothetical protein